MANSPGILSLPTELGVFDLTSLPAQNSNFGTERRGDGPEDADLISLPAQNSSFGIETLGDGDDLCSFLDTVLRNTRK